MTPSTGAPTTHQPDCSGDSHSDRGKPRRTPARPGATERSTVPEFLGDTTIAVLKELAVRRVNPSPRRVFEALTTAGIDREVALRTAGLFAWINQTEYFTLVHDWAIADGYTDREFDDMLDAWQAAIGEADRKRR